MTGVGAKGSESCCHIILKNIMWGPKPASYQLVLPENSKSCSFCSDFIVSIHGFWPHYFVSIYKINSFFIYIFQASIQFHCNCLKTFISRSKEKYRVKISLPIFPHLFVSI